MLSDNSAYQGGAIFNSSGKMTLTGCTLSDNRATGDSGGNGGAIYSNTSADFISSFTALRNCTLSSNAATNAGGALYNADGVTSLRSCSVLFNAARPDQGGGVASVGNAYTQTRLGNSIVAGSSSAAPETGGDSSSDLDFLTNTSGSNTTNSFVSDDTNLLGDGNALSSFNGAKDQQNIDDFALKLSPLQDNGGSTPTHALLPGSPAIDAGETSFTTDQRGVARPQGSADDIGAFESQPPAPNAPPVNGSVTPASAIDAPHTARTFTAAYSDPNGATDISLVALRIGGNANNSANSLLCVYNATTNKLSLYNDAATALIGSVTPGTAAPTATPLSDGQGTLNTMATTVLKNGNTLTVNWNVSATGAFADTKQTTFLFVRDTKNLSQGYTAKGTWTISGNARPSTVSVSPAVVTRAVGIEQFFTTKFTDSNGWKNLQFVTLRLGGSGTSSSNAMVCVYNVQNNKLYLFDDAGNYVPQADFPGRATVLQNSQGSLDCARTTVTGNGNTLVVKWSVKAKAAFAGSRAIALLCADRANLRDGYDTYGTWTITQAAPGVPATAQVSTASASASASGQNINLVFTGAAPQAGYAVTVNGASVEVTQASVQGSKAMLSLPLALHAGDKVVVTWPGGETSLTVS